MEKMSEKEIYYELKKGDYGAACMEIHRIMEAVILRVAERYAVPPHEREDISQECYLEIFGTAKNWDPGKGALKTYFTPVIRYCCEKYCCERSLSSGLSSPSRYYSTMKRAIKKAETALAAECGTDGPFEDAAVAEKASEILGKKVTAKRVRNVRMYAPDVMSLECLDIVANHWDDIDLDRDLARGNVGQAVSRLEGLDREILLSIIEEFNETGKVSDARVFQRMYNKKYIRRTKEAQNFNYRYAVAKKKFRAEIEKLKNPDHTLKFA